MNLLLMFLALGFSSPTPALAQQISSTTVTYSTSTAQLIVESYAAHWGISADQLWQTINCEDPGLDPAANGDHGLARGLAQIRSDYHPDVTDAEAHDPFFSINFMASYFAKGQAKQWTCYRRLFL